MQKVGYSLERITINTGHLHQVRKAELYCGDVMQITTRNSVYSVKLLADGTYQVSGGWFDKKRLSPFRTTINGCTWGGTVVKTDVAAACGLHLEFGNRVVTTPIQRVCLFRSGIQN